MCGRFTQHYTWREVHDLYGLVGTARNVEPRYNIAPTSTIDVVQPTADGPALLPMRSGLIPSWWKRTAKDVPSTFNARAEAVADKPMFRSAFKGNRCIVPASGYFESKTMPDGNNRISSAPPIVACSASRVCGTGGTAPALTKPCCPAP
jgi:putative SOS response-associated peptidase YedK